MIAGAIAGCNSGSSSSSDSGNTANRIRVIDGYLHNAEVCAQTDDECVVIGQTDKNGFISIPDKFSENTIIARVIAGETFDSDTVGFVGRSYEMRSAEGASVITPFTTMAASEELSLEDVASAINLDQELVRGDYVASVNEQSSRVHLVARTMANQLSSDFEGNNELLELATLINEQIDHIDSELDLDQIHLEVKDGDVLDYPRIATPRDFIEGYDDEKKSRYLASLNGSFFKDEGIELFEFDPATRTYFNEKDGERPYEFDADGNLKNWDQVIYTSPEFMFTVPSNGDMSVWSITDFGTEKQGWSEDKLLGKTWHVIDDDSTSSIPVPMFATLTFDSIEHNVEIEECGETMTLPWAINDGILTIDFPEGDNDLVINLAHGNGDIALGTNEEANNRPMILTKEASVAHRLFKDWSGKTVDEACKNFSW